MNDQELRTLVIYDVAHDRIRLRLAQACKDYGLEHIQYSAFSGPLNSTQRQQLAARLTDTLGRERGRILVVPVCEKDAASACEVRNA